MNFVLTKPESVQPALVRFLLAVGLVCAAFALLAKAIGGLLPVGDWLPVQLTDFAGEFDQEIVVVDLGRGLDFNLTRNAVWDQSPALSPDGRHIAYASQDGTEIRIFIADILTGESQPLMIDAPGSNQVDMDWSPDGTQLAFVSNWGTNNGIYIADVATGETRRMSDPQFVGMNPDWSPDGRYIAFVATSLDDPADLFIMPVQCGQPDGVCGREAIQMTQQPGTDRDPTWSPDGSQIAFISDRGGTNDIYIMDTDCLRSSDPCIPSIRPMTQSRFQVAMSDLDWSPDGTQLRFVVYQPYDFPGATFYGLDAGCDLLPERCMLHRLMTLNR